MFGLLVYSNNLNNKFLIDDYRYLNNPPLSMKLVLYELNPYRLYPSASLGPTGFYTLLLSSSDPYAV